LARWALSLAATSEDGKDTQLFCKRSLRSADSWADRQCVLRRGLCRSECRYGPSDDGISVIGTILDIVAHLCALPDLAFHVQHESYREKPSAAFVGQADMTRMTRWFSSIRVTSFGLMGGTRSAKPLGGVLAPLSDVSS